MEMFAIFDRCLVETVYSDSGLASWYGSKTSKDEDILKERDMKRVS